MRNIWTTLVFGLIYSCTSQEVVQTTSGAVSGFSYSGRDGRQYQLYLGIPYARVQRFQKPIPSSWSGVLNATRYGPICVQNGNPPEVQTVGMSEDCLTLNIFYPRNNQGYLPVFFYIHGGSLQTGSAAKLPVDGIVNNLASRFVIVVTIQYRIGMLGFFTTLTPDFPPNLGIRDQILALEWVRANIHNFGGDPSRITVGGQSAGACSVDALSMTPRVPDYYFRSVIQLSGTAEVCFDGTFGYQNNSEIRAQAYCNVTLKMPADPATSSRLKQCLQNVNYTVFFPLEDKAALGWQMVVDGDLFPNVPEVLIKSAPKRPRLMGVTSDEWSNFELERLALTGQNPNSENRTSVVGYLDTILSFFGANSSIVLNKILKNYAEPIIAQTGGEKPGTWFQIVTTVLSDGVFNSRVALEATRLLDEGNEGIFLYNFTYAGRSFYRNAGFDPVGHSDDLTFLFSLTNSSFFPTTSQENSASSSTINPDSVVTNNYADIITNFVINQRPIDFSVALQTPEWQYLDINIRPEWKTDFAPTARRLWNGDFKQFGDFPPIFNASWAAYLQQNSQGYRDTVVSRSRRSTFLHATAF